MSQTVTLKGSPVHLVGAPPQVGTPAPDFALRDTPGSVKSLVDYVGKVKIVSVVPSLDTPVCALQTKAFSAQIGELGEGVVCLTVSIDTPMAQKRWCGAEGVANVVTLSDFYDHNFGQTWGLRIRENGLLARSVFVLDGDNVVRYAQLVPEIAQEPDYAPVIAAAKSLL